MSAIHVSDRAEPFRLSPRRGRRVARFVAVLIAMLAVATIICVGAIAPVIWEFSRTSIAPRQEFGTGPCAAINDDRVRLACYDRRAGKPVRVQAKGVSGPSLIAPPQAGR